MLPNGFPGTRKRPVVSTPRSRHSFAERTEFRAVGRRLGRYASLKKASRDSAWDGSRLAECGRQCETRLPPGSRNDPCAGEEASASSDHKFRRFQRRRYLSRRGQKRFKNLRR